MSPIKTQILVNNAPFTDVTTVSDPPSCTHTAVSTSDDNGTGVIRPRHPPRIYTTAGKARSGAICEIAYGYEAAVGAYLDLRENQVLLANSILPLQTPWHDHDALIVSSPVQSVLISDPTGENLTFEQIASEPTLAASILLAGNISLSCHVLTFVLHSGIQVFHCRTDGSIEQVATCPTGRVQYATIDAVTGLVLLVLHNEGGSIVLLKQVVQDSESDNHPTIVDVGTSHVLSQEVTAVALHIMAPVKSKLTGACRAYACLGLQGATIEIYEISATSGLELLAEKSGLFTSNSVINDIKVLSNTTAEPGTRSHMHIILGSRTGSLHICDFEHDDTNNTNPVGLTNSLAYSLGNGPVTINVHDEFNNHGLVLHCDSGLFRLQYRRGRPFRVTKIIITRSDDQSVRFPSPRCVCIYGISSSRVNIAYLLGDELAFSVVSEDSKGLARKMPMPGTPSRILYSRHLRLLVVGGSITREYIPSESRSSSMVIHLVDSSWQEGLTGFMCNGDVPQPSILATFEGDAGESLLALQEWSITREDVIHHFIIVTTIEKHPATDSHHSGKRKGAIKFLRVSKTAKGEYSLALYQESKENDPVYAICAFDKANSLLYCTGNEIKMRTYISEEKR